VIRRIAPLIVAALALSACAAEDSGPATPATPAAGPVHPERLRLGPTSRFDLSRGEALRVLTRDRGSVRASIVVGGRSLALAAPVPARGGPVRVGVRRETVEALRSCRPARLEVAVRGGGGKVLSRVTRAMPGDPPACGRFFNARSVWNRPLSPRASRDKLSDTLVADLGKQVQAGFNQNFPPTINTVSYSAPMWTATADQKAVPVKLVGSRVSYGQALAKVLAGGVPIPRGAREAWGGDHHLVVWQPSTDTMWELWGAQKTKAGRWTAQWGGRMDHLSRSPGYFTDASGVLAGATASSLPLAGGLITRADLARGRIDHALAMAIPSTREGVWSLPAQRSDGNVKSATSIPQGARFRLDPKLDIDAMHLPRFTAMMAKAAQRYGIYVRDTSPTVTFYAEDPVTIGSNPWPKAISPSSAAVLKAFPWDRLQVMPMKLFTWSHKPVPR
jgi:hypothetical protein